jgi:hypothetical protein
MHDTVKSGISRRTVVKGATWSVPAIIVAGAAPAAAVSGSLVDFTGNACKLPGSSTPNKKSYRFDMTSTNPTGGAYGDVIVVVTSFEFNGDTASDFDIQVTNGTECVEQCGSFGGMGELCVGDGSVIQWRAITGPFPDSQNGQATICYDVYDAATCQKIASLSACTTSGPLNTPPCPQEH